MPSFASKFALAIALAAASLAAPTVFAAAQSTQTPAERNFNQGETYFKANNWAAAIPYYKAAVAADPSFATAYYSLGLAYYQNKDPKDAANAFKMYLKYKPTDAPGLVLLGISLHAAGDNAGAVDALHKVIDLKPEAKYLNSAYYNIGVAYEDAHQLPEAMQTYIVLRTISPKDAQDLLDYMRSVDPDLKAADAAPSTPAKTAPTPASGPSASAKPASPAIAPPSQTTSTKSGISSAADYLAQGKAKYEAKDYSQAVILYGMAVQLDPNLADGYFELSMVYFQLGKYDLVRSSAKKYESLKPGDPNGFMMEAFADRKLDRNAEAITALNAAIPLKPEPTTNLPSCYYELGMNYYRLGKTQEVNQVYQKLKTINAKWPQDLYDAIHDSDAPAAPSGAAKPAPDPSKQAGLDLVNSHIALEVGAVMRFEELDYSDKIFVLQYRDYSPENKNAADGLWAKIRAQEKDGAALLQIPKALVISATKTTIDVALMSDNQQAKLADTHVTLSKPLVTPPARGSSITIYGVITSYTAKPFLFTVERGQLTPPSGTASSARPASTPQAPAPATAAASALPATPAAKLPDLPDLPAARTAIQSAAIIAAGDLTLNDVIFVLQYRDASTANQAAAKKIWSEVLEKEKGGEPLLISNALVISSTKTTVELALSDDCKRAKKADTHLILAKPLAAPARAGLVTDISGEITSYKTNPIMLTMERGQLLTASGAGSTSTSPSTSTQTAHAKRAPADDWK